ncbi:type 1 glutamine amidotransferase domain-containing protein [Fictibacillus sp. NRS-1165]|uniref:type 1 glutamine amidotransferase domain-containing protein n=1 Tax=Fictibacillus sp. NRS-1165 TaxID=3144463 RepID=UPI003D2088F7
MAKIATVMTNLFEDVEYTDPAKALKEAGHEVVVISSEKGKKIEGKQKEATVTADAGIGDVSPSDFDALFIPGGFSPDQLRDDERFVSFAKNFADNGKPIFAICHGPQLLITAGVLKDRKVTGYNSIKVDLINAGANFVDEEVAVSGGHSTENHLPFFQN